MTGDVRDFETVLAVARPRLHRYCARMTGSAVDGEDVVQDTMLKALVTWNSAGPVDNVEGWLFRIAHNTALDALRLRRHDTRPLDEEHLEIAADTPDPDAASASLRTFLRLPVLQRSVVILKDVLGHSVEEAATITGASGAAVKSALQRGRSRLRELAREPGDVVLPLLSDRDREQLLAYVECFQRGDFDAVRAMLAEDVRLDLVARLQRSGKAKVGEYFGRYATSDQWVFAAGAVDGQAAMLVYDRHDVRETPAHFVVLGWSGSRVAWIRDFLFAPYVLDGAGVLTLPPAE